MGYQHTFRDSKGQIMSVELSIPEQCPFCNRHIAPRFHSVSCMISDSEEQRPIVGYWSCNGCGEVFAVRYQLLRYNRDKGWFCGIKSLYPPLLSLTPIDERVEKVSPRFVDILHQAEKAKANDLVDLAGMGFRKALEYLIKDYLIHKAPDDEEKIRNMELGNCIANRIENQQLKAVASRASWLGNDFAHYSRKFDEYEISDLRRFIDAVLYWVLMELTTEEALAIEPRK